MKEYFPKEKPLVSLVGMGGGPGGYTLAESSVDTSWSLDNVRYPSDSGGDYLNLEYMPWGPNNYTYNTDQAFQFMSLVSDSKIVVIQEQYHDIIDFGTANELNSGTRTEPKSHSSNTVGSWAYDVSFWWKPDGTEFFKLSRYNGSSIGTYVSKYTCSTPYRLENSSVTLVGTQTGFTNNPVYDTSSSGSGNHEPKSISFKSDGTKMWIIWYANYPSSYNEFVIGEISLTTAWDPTGGHTASYTTVNINSLSHTTFIPGKSGVHWYDSGNKFIVFGKADADATPGYKFRDYPVLLQYNASSAYSISSATLNTSTTKSGWPSNTLYAHQYLDSICINSTGTRMYLGGGSNNPRITQYEMSTPYDFSTITTASFDHIGWFTDLDSLGRNTSYYASFARDITASEDVFFTAIAGYDNVSPNNNKGWQLHKYEFSTPGDPTSTITNVSKVYFSDFGAPSADGFGNSTTSPPLSSVVQDIRFNRSTIYANGANRAPGCFLTVTLRRPSSSGSLRVYNFTSTTPYTFNSSTASLANSVDMDPLLRSSDTYYWYYRNIQWAPDGMAFFLYGSSYQQAKMTVTTAYDLSTVSSTTWFDHTSPGGGTNPSSPDSLLWKDDGTRCWRFTGWGEYSGFFQYDVSTPFDLSPGNSTYSGNYYLPDLDPGSSYLGDYKKYMNNSSDYLGMTFSHDGKRIWKLPSQGGDIMNMPNVYYITLSS